MPRVVILQSNYIPWKGYFDLIANADIFVFYDSVQYTKNDWRNRNKIYSKNGQHWLTIPVPNKAVKSNIDEARPTDHAWCRKHRMSITQTYSRAPFFSQLEPLLDGLYGQTPWELLIDINRYAIKTISEMIGCNTRFVCSSELELKGDKVERLLHILTQLGATEYLSGPAARDYLATSESRFLEAGIKLKYKRYDKYPTYRQRREPFCHDVSILDVIAHVPIEELRQYVVTDAMDSA